MLLGVDVSNHQRRVDWDLVSGAGYSFGIVKSSEGVGFRDVWMDRNLDEMARLGMVRGVYHYANPDHNHPLAEAEFFLDVVAGKLKPGDLIALDMEEGDAANLAQWSLTWLGAVRDEYGMKPLFYSYPHFMQTHGLNNNENLCLYPLWYASYRDSTPPVPGSWPKIEIWQNAVQPGVPGVAGDCDRNKYLGGETAADLLKLGIPTGNEDAANIAFDAYLWSLSPSARATLGEKLYRGDLTGRGHWGGDPLPVLRLERGLLIYANGVVSQATGLALDDWQQTVGINRF